MASCLRVRLSNVRCLCRFYSSSRAGQNGRQDENNRKWNSNIVTLSASSLLLVGCGTALWLTYRKHGGNLFTPVHAASPSISNKSRRKENANNPLGSSLSRLSSRERRFVQFASAEYGGQLYMTPQDFLESVIEAEPRPRLKRRILQQQNLTAFNKATPSLSTGSPRTFRELRDQGIISYTEYLFLLSILTKPRSGFRIAFNMFDTDGNARVDKQEFMVLLGVLCRKVYREDELKGLDPLILERIFSHAYRDRRGLLRPKSTDCDEKDCDEKKQPESTATKKIKYQEQEALNALDEGLQRRHEIDTTLLVHLFGKSGTRELTYEQFSAFMENLQTEVLEMEFLEFSKGLATITELDFAKILLRYTQLDPDTYDEYLDRLLESDAEEKGITFQEFLVFCTFLNNLEDFAVAMRMYSLADRPISEDEFQRAVKICTGSELSPHVVRTVFLLFDEDGDGRLSDREFVAIMRDRIHRGLKSYTRSEGWDAFKHCVKQEMKSAI